MRHTWSLAIEEQFYLVWPFVVALALRRNVVVLGAVAASGVVASVVAMAALYDAADPSRAYFGSGARVHQMLLGVLLAIALLGRSADGLRRVGRVLVVPASVGLILAMFLLEDTDDRYYRGGSLVVALATVALVAGLDGGHRVVRALSWRPLVLIGTLSYGLYLWHWPIITVAGIQGWSTSSPMVALGAVAATFVVAGVSFHFLEQPIRSARQLFGRRIRPGLVLGLVPVMTLVALGIVAVSTRDVEAPEWTESANPAVLELAHVPVTAVGESDPRRPLTVGMVGDSVSVSLLPGIREQAALRNFRLVEAAVPACPVGYQPLYDDLGVQSPFYEERCRDTVRSAHDALIEAAPDLVIWHDLQSVLSRRDENGALLVSASAGWQRDLISEWTEVLERFHDAGAHVVIISPPLRSVEPLGDCSAAKIPTRCADIQRQDETIRAATTALVDKLDPDRVTVVDVDDVLCPSGNPCPAEIDGLVVRIGGSDQTHFTEEGARWFAPLVLDRIDRTTGGALDVSSGD